MKLIIQKGEKYTNEDFFKQVIHYEYIDGITLNVAKTNDDVLVVFNLASSSNVLIKNIYESSYQQLKNLEVISLETVIRYLSQINYPKKILLNLIPYKLMQLTEEQNKLLIEEYKTYARLLKNCLQDINLQIGIHSVSRSLLEFVRKSNITTSFGFAVVGYDLNYIDVDYYIFTVDMLNLPLIKQQIGLGKDVIIYIQNDFELSFIYDMFLGAKKTDLTKEIYKDVHLMGNYPEVLKKTFDK